MQANPSLAALIGERIGADWVLEGDRHIVLADCRGSVDAPREVDRVFVERDEWTRRSILNVARVGRFSSDRAILEYAKNS